MSIPSKSLCIAIIIAVEVTFGDEILLKSGGKVSGIVVSRENGSVTVNMGFGTSVFDTADIDSIILAPGMERQRLQKQWKSSYDDREKQTPPEVKTFVERMRNLRTLRTRAVTRKYHLTRLKKEIDSLEHEMTLHRNEYAAINTDLDSLGKKALAEQYRIVGRAQQYNASLIFCRQSLETKTVDFQNGNPSLLEYADTLLSIDHDFTVFLGSNKAGTSAPEIGTVASDLKLLRGEFTTAAIDATFINGNSILVEAVFNNRFKVALIVDTGASQVVLSQRCAARLGIDWHKGKPIETTLANGEKETGYQVRLKSVALSKFRLDNVSAIVLKNPPGPGIDGLLGMSFLRSFIVGIDGQNRKLVLRQFNE